MSAESGDVFVDTNVLVYLFDTSAPRKREEASTLVANRRCVVSTQVLGEFYMVTTRKLTVPLCVDDAQTFVDGWPSARVVPTTHALVCAAVTTSREHQLSYWDALIIEAAAASGCDTCYTEDLSDRATIRGVRIINPFALA
jgi:predicted nucleic acid-binding protein